jgi:hypothetical protein
MELIRSIAVMTLFGKPLIMYGGILTLGLFLFTAYIAVANSKGNHTIPFSWHSKFALISIGFACMHGLLAMSMYW